MRADAVTAIFELLESRYQLGEVALSHRTKLTASAMLERFIAEIADAAQEVDWFSGQVDRLLGCTDEQMLDLLVELGRRSLAGAEAWPQSEYVARWRWLLAYGTAGCTNRFSRSSPSSFRAH